MLLEGVKYQDNAFVFDFDVDGEKEIVKLTEDVKRSSIYENVFYYAYEFGDDVDSKIRSKFIHDLKFKSEMGEREKERFMRTAVNKFCLHEKLDTFDCIVHPQSESKIVVRMLEYISNGCGADVASYEYIKNFYEFPDKKSEAAYKSIENKKVLLIDDIATSGRTIQMLLRSLNTLAAKEIVVFSLIGNSGISNVI